MSWEDNFGAERASRIPIFHVGQIAKELRAGVVVGEGAECHHHINDGCYDVQ